MSVELETGPCLPWCRMEDVHGCSACSGTDAYLTGQFIDVASELLFNLSGRQFAGGYDTNGDLAACSETIRPCASHVTARNMPAWNYETVWTMESGSWDGPFFPWGWWPSGGFCGCENGGALERGCSCEGLSQIALPNFPVSSVTEVKVDGTALTAGTDYAVDDFYWLVRLGDEHWPCCNNLRKPDTETGTWSVTYEYGQPPPLAGVKAAAELACQLTQACSGGSCQLPARVTQVVREQVTFTIAADLEAMFAAGHIGLTMCDYFLTSFNPRSIRQQPSVWSPDLGVGSVRRTWP